MSQTAAVKHKAHTHVHICWACSVIHLTLEAFFLQLFQLKLCKILSLSCKGFTSGLLNDAQEIPSLQGRTAQYARTLRCFQEVDLPIFIKCASAVTFCAFRTAKHPTMHFTSTIDRSSSSKKFVFQSTDLQVCTSQDHKIIIIYSDVAFFTAQSDVRTSPNLL